MDIEHIEWCTHMLDLAVEQLNKKYTEGKGTWWFVDNCSMQLKKGLDFFSDGCSSVAYELRKSTDLQALRMYGDESKAMYTYVQYIVGAGLQIRTKEGICIFINKANSMYSKRLVSPQIIGYQFPKSFFTSRGKVNPGAQTANSTKLSLLSLFDLAYGSKYYDIICFNTFDYTEFYRGVIHEMINTLGLYSVYPMTGLTAGYMEDHLVVARSKGVFLKYFKPVEEEV